MVRAARLSGVPVWELLERPWAWAELYLEAERAEVGAQADVDRRRKAAQARQSRRRRK